MPEHPLLAALDFDPEYAARKRRRLLGGAWVLRAAAVVCVWFAVYQSWWWAFAPAIVLGFIAELMLHARKGAGASVGQHCVAVGADGVMVSAVAFRLHQLTVPWNEIESINVFRAQSTLRARLDVEDPTIANVLPDGGLFVGARSIQLVLSDPARFSASGADSSGLLGPRGTSGMPRRTQSIPVNTSGSVSGEVFHAFLKTLAAESERHGIAVRLLQPAPAQDGPRPGRSTASIGALGDVLSRRDSRPKLPRFAFLAVLVAIVAYVVWAAFVLQWYLLLLFAVPFAILGILMILTIVRMFSQVAIPAVALGRAGITTPQITVPWVDIESIVVLLHHKNSRARGETGQSISATLPTGLLFYGAKSILMVLRDPDSFTSRVGARRSLLVRGGLFGVPAGRQAVPCDIATSEIGPAFFDFIKLFEIECAKRGIPVTAY